MMVGFSIIVSHLLSYTLVLVGAENLTGAERSEISLLISPVFAVYVTAIVRRFTAPEAAFDDSPTHPALRVLSLGTSAIFSVAVPLVIYLFIVGKIENLPALKMTLGSVETALGIYTGAVVDRLFGFATKSAKTKRPRNS
jgi:hypothetical protein